MRTAQQGLCSSPFIPRVQCRDERGDGPISDPKPCGAVPHSLCRCSAGCSSVPGLWGEFGVAGTAQVSLTMMISIGMGIRIFFMYLRLSSLTTIRSTALTKA